MAFVIPGEDESAEQVARDLLSLTDNVYDVQTNTDHGLMFVVPDALAEAYSRLHAEVRAGQHPLPAGEEATAPKRRGSRARKEQ